MNKKEIVQLIMILCGNYESIAQKSQEQKDIMANTWYACLYDLDYKVVLMATKKSIMESPYPPTIHDIRKNALEFTSPTTKRTSIEAWEEAYKMICRGTYMTQEEFDKASEEVKAFFGNVRQVSDLAKSDLETVNTVTKGQFMKQYDILVNRNKQEKLLPESMKQITKQLSENMSANKFLS